MNRGKPVAARTSTAASVDVFSDPSRACAALARKDRALARALETIERPCIRRRPGGFEGLFRIIVEQQVSVPSAQAIWSRCRARFDPVEPQAVATAGVEELKSLGLSGPKARYVAGLAEAGCAGGLQLDDLPTDDVAASRALQAHRGVGPWTAAIYLLFCEGRVDIWPPKDIALLRAYQAASGQGLTLDRLDADAARWAPWRGVAAHMLWTYYAHLRGRTPI